MNWTVPSSPVEMSKRGKGCRLGAGQELCYSSGNIQLGWGDQGTAPRMRGACEEGSGLFPSLLTCSPQNNT